jgi:hypothetical protein
MELTAFWVCKQDSSTAEATRRIDAALHTDGRHSFCCQG